MQNLKRQMRPDGLELRQFTGAGAIKRRIMDMGITKGYEIFVRKSRLWDPVEVTVRRYELRCRKGMPKIFSSIARGSKVTDEEDTIGGKIALPAPEQRKTTLFNALTGSNSFVGNWPRRHC